MADVYDALVSERVYKKKIGKNMAYHMIQDGECGVFAPKLMRAFEDAKEEFEKIADEQ